MTDRSGFFACPTPHARQKLDILGRYSGAWASILGRGAAGRVPTLNTVETHAGRGQYETGDPGSPLVTLRALDRVVAGAHAPLRANVHLVELDTANAAMLRRVVAETKWNPSIRIQLYSGDAREVLPGILAGIDPIEPAFFFVDPFGYSDLSFRQLMEVLRHGERHELMLTFMSQFIFRFLADPTKRDVQEDLLGPYGEWRQWVGVPGAELQVIDHFCDRVERAGLRCIGRQPLAHVIELAAVARHRPYVLLHISQHPKARITMEEAVHRSGAASGATRRLFNETAADDTILQALASAALASPARDVAAAVWHRTRHLSWLQDIRVALKRLHAAGQIEVTRAGRPLGHRVSYAKDTDMVKLLR